MLLLSPAQIATLSPWFLPEQPGPLVGSHVIRTGHGACWADRWPNPRAVLAETGGNYTLRGDVGSLSPSDVQPHIRGFLDADASFAPLLYAAFPELQEWPRIIFDPLPTPAALPALAPSTASRPVSAPAPIIRRLGGADAPHLAGLEPASAWISKSWGGPQGLAQSGCAWGAFAGGALAAVACTFFQGYTYEDIGVVTSTAWRGQGLSTACAEGLCRDIFARGRQPTWATSPDNAGSLRVAQKLGFTTCRRDVSYVIGIEIPT